MVSLPWRTFCRQLGATHSVMRSLHSSPTLFATLRLTNERIPFSRAVLVVPPPVAPKNPLIPPPPYKPFNPNGTHISNGTVINVKEYLRGMNRRKHRIELAKPDRDMPVVVLVDLEDEFKRGGAPKTNDNYPRLENKRIPYEQLWLIETRGAERKWINLPHYLKHTMNDKIHKVELVADWPEPVARLINRADARAERLQHKAEAKANKRTERKEIQLTWSVAPADLATKVRQMRRELARGTRCDVVFAMKDAATAKGRQNIRQLQVDVMQAMLDNVLDQVSDIATCYKPTEIQKVRGIGVIYLQAKEPEST